MAGRLGPTTQIKTPTTAIKSGRLGAVNKPYTSGTIINEMLKSGQATTTPMSSLPSRIIKKLPNIDTALNDQLLKKGISQETINKQYATPSGLSNFIGGLKQVGTDIQKKTTDYFEPVAGKTRIRDVAREAQTITKNLSVPKSEEEAKKMGMVKFGNTYMDPTAAVGSLKNVAKEGLDAVGKQLLKNIKNYKPAQESLDVLKDTVYNGLKKLSGKSQEFLQAGKISLDNFGEVNNLIKTLEKEKTPNQKTINQGLELLKLHEKVLPPVTFNPEKYVAEQVAKQNAVKKVDQPGIVGSIGNFLKEAKVKLVDSNAPIEDLLSSYTKKNKITLKPSENITNQIDRVYRAPVLAGQFARDNGLETVIKKVDSLENLDQYLIAKQAKDVASNGIETGRDLAKDQALIDSFQSKYEPIAQQINDYSKKLLDYSVDSGLVNKELADALKIKYPNYVPLNRVFNELEKGGVGGNKAVASLSKQTILQKLVGSERQIESPIESLLIKTNDAFLQGEKNKAAKLLTSYKDLPGNPFQLRELKAGESAPYTVSVLDNGVKKIYETTKEIEQAAKSLNVQQLGVLMKTVAIPTRVAKVGITGINLPFIASNVAKDQVTGIINSNNALRTSVANPLVFLKSLYNAVGHGKLYEEMVRAGGSGTSFDIARNQVTQTVERIRSGRSVGSKILYTVKHPSELLRDVENIVGRSEELTRIQQYAGTKQALLKQGMSEKEAIIGAAKAARENTVNFARRGEFGTVLNTVFLYINAGIQGTRTFLRNMTEKPIATSAKIALTVFTPVAATTLWNLSDPERKAAYEDIAEFEKENNIIIVPPNPTKDENGKWNIIKIPLSQEINNLASLARRPIEQSFGLDPVRAGEVAKAFIGTVSPINPTKGSVMSTIMPQALKPSVESYMNKNLYTGYKQVSDTMSKLSPELQVKPTTSGTAIELGKILKQSPIKIEEWIKGTVGSVGSQALHLSDLALNKMEIIPADQIHGQRISEAIISRFMKATGGAEDEKANKNLENLLMKQADENFRIKQEAELLYEEFKKLPKEEAAKKYDDLYEINPILAKQISKTAADEKLGLDYNDRLIMQLQVKNGERAKFIYETLKTFTTKEEKAKYYGSLLDKKIISEEVGNQIKYLLKENK